MTGSARLSSSRSAVTSSLMVSSGATSTSGGRLPHEGVEAAGHRRDRRPLIRDDAIGDPGRIARRAGGAGEPFAALAGRAVLGLFEIRHEEADPHGRPVRQQRLQRIARAVEFARFEGGPGDRQAALRRAAGRAAPGSRRA